MKRITLILLVLLTLILASITSPLTENSVEPEAIVISSPYPTAPPYGGIDGETYIKPEAEEVQADNEEPEELDEPEEIVVSSPFTITSPYDGVDWVSFGQFKASLHAHTTNSDGAHSPASVLEAHYRIGYDIVAITDHNYLTRDWVSVRNGLTQERFEEMTAGVGRDGRGMLQVTLTNEQSHHDHLNTFFTDYNSSPGNTLDNLRRSMQEAEDMGGISRLNHPGRYPPRGDIGGGNEQAVANSNSLEKVMKYVDLFMEFPSCVGMEIINRKDVETKTDRILWDNINEQAIPQGRFVWGFSEDDSHQNSEIGFSYNMFVLAENTLENFREAMFSGSFYSVARVAFREDVNNKNPDVPTPRITNIEVDRVTASIAISAENYERIEWITAGTETIHTGNTIYIEEHSDNIVVFIRANIIGPGGVAFTQPFGITYTHSLADSGEYRLIP